MCNGSAHENAPEQNSYGKSDQNKPASPAAQQNEKEKRKKNIELKFNAKGPGMRESGPAAQSEVLRKGQEFPERRHSLELAYRRRKKRVSQHNYQISGQNPERAAPVKLPDGERFPGDGTGEQLPANKVAAQDEEKVDANPPIPIDSKGQTKSEEARVINNDRNNGYRPQ
jgi:hypothetical protein